LHWRYEAKRVPKCLWLCLVLAVSVLQKNSVSCDISIFEITGGSDSLKFSESASEIF
jgi:hypothetical protein